MIQFCQWWEWAGKGSVFIRNFSIKGYKNDFKNEKDKKKKALNLVFIISLSLVIQFYFLACLVIFD